MKIIIFVLLDSKVKLQYNSCNFSCRLYAKMDTSVCVYNFRSTHFQKAFNKNTPKNYYVQTIKMVTTYSNMTGNVTNKKER